ncbi:MAG: carboxymuconolactone decarboxylase [Piscirickettsiaceae bacterium]|nr:MAG: carboxymuconolactone decarboxylase [Piscirickettsiaceae bacterium]
MKFQLHNLQTAPSNSIPLLENSIKSFGMVPNLHAVMAESPTALNAYKQLHEWFQETGFNADELTVIWQTINVEHQCHYCIPAHTGIAHMMNVDQDIIDALLNRQSLPNEKLQVLHKTTLSLVQNRGHLSDEERDAFYKAGYENKHLLGILVGMAQKVMSNYTNHLAETPVDSMFEKFI